ncbi:MAG: CapA family protein [Eubacteriales bacterium]|nr:CapA family protein [Eubacteriales bacterium]
MEKNEKEKRMEEMERKIRIHRKKKRMRYLRIGIPVGILALALCIFGGVKIANAVKSRPASSNASAPENAALETVESESETTTETEFPETQITVSLIGDCTLGTDENFYWDTSLNAYYNSYGSAYFFQNVKSILEADDLTVANMEGTLTTSQTRENKLFAFKADSEYAQILVDGSVEAANLANNHSSDYGEQSYTDTITALEDVGITTFGYDRTAVMDVKGVQVGLVGIYELDIHMECQTQLLENIEKVKEEGAQVIIVVFHWGNEKETVPDSNQIALGHMAIDNGADLVVGHHSHVLQGIERYKGKYIAYSLGNFCFGGNTNPFEYDTVIFQQTFTVNAQGVAVDENVNLIPCSVSSVGSYNNYQPTPAEGEEAERILQKLEERSQNIPGTTEG